MSAESFSFRELQETSRENLPASRRLQASDGTTLYYRCYLPPNSPGAVVLFYHGGGAHNGAGYQHIGNGLQNNYNIAVYMPDIRGHGASGGPRGDAPNPRQVWEDITSFIKQIRIDYPDILIFLGGHSSGAGLVLNYASQADRLPVNGYVFLSPQLGVHALADRPNQAAPFARVDQQAFIDYASSRTAAHGHDYAVHFNYPAKILAADPGLVAAITVNMSISLIPNAPQNQFANLDRPFGLWIGSDDELFLPDKVLAFGDLANAVRADSQVSAIPGAKHLSVLLGAYEPIGAWITRMIHVKKKSP